MPAGSSSGGHCAGRVCRRRVGRARAPVARPPASRGTDSAGRGTARGSPTPLPCFPLLRLQLYKQYVDPEFTWSNFTLEEQAKVGGRRLGRREAVAVGVLTQVGGRQRRASHARHGACLQTNALLGAHPPLQVIVAPRSNNLMAS